MEQIFRISIKDGYRQKYYTVKHIPVDDHRERFELIGRNKMVLLESNRPLFRNRGLKHRKPDWRIIEGQVNYQSSLTPFTTAILEYLEPLNQSKLFK